MFAVVLMLRGFVGAEEERVVWWGKDGFVGTKDWMLLYVENGQPGIVHPHPHTLSSLSPSPCCWSALACVSTRAYE